MAKCMEGRTLPTHATEWEARCFSVTIAALVASGVSLEEREITSLVVLEDMRYKIAGSSDVKCFTESPCSPSSSLLLTLRLCTQIPYLEGSSLSLTMEKAQSE